MIYNMLGLLACWMQLNYPIKCYNYIYFGTDVLVYSERFTLLKNYIHCQKKGIWIVAPKHRYANNVKSARLKCSTHGTALTKKPYKERVWVEFNYWTAKPVFWFIF